jgi:hypothetical protein
LSRNTYSQFYSQFEKVAKWPKLTPGTTDTMRARAAGDSTGYGDGSETVCQQWRCKKENGAFVETRR